MAPPSLGKPPAGQQRQDVAGAAQAWRALAQGRLSQALAQFERHLDQSPDDPKLLLGKAQALRRLGRREPALQTYHAVLRREPGNETALAEMLRLIGRNRPRQALERLLDIHSAHPEDAGIAAQVGMIYVQLGELNRALGFLEQAIAREPDKAVYVFNLGVLYDRLGRRAEAIRLYGKAIDLGVSASVPKAAVEERLRYLQALGEG
jgi:Flp pilus assembly protein TadD